MLNEKITIAVDAMGGDNAPKEIIKGAVDSLALGNVNIVLVGKEDIINAELAKYTYDKALISVLNASEEIGNDESPTQAIKSKKNSSIVIGLNYVSSGKADAFVSAGNTGAILTGSTVIVGRIKGIERPALATLLPNAKGFTLLIDCGANVDSKPSYLAQFAMMGSVYMSNVNGISKPRVGLINVGAEKEKGNSLTKEAYELLEKQNINFVGNVEARDIPLGAVDVAVCDAFVGNVILKYSEGFAKGLLGMLKDELMSSFVTKIGAGLSKSAFNNLRKRMDYSEVGGAPFIGLKALVVKAHGSSNAKAIRGAINQCVTFKKYDIVSKISANISES